MVSSGFILKNNLRIGSIIIESSSRRFLQGTNETTSHPHAHGSTSDHLLMAMGLVIGWIIFMAMGLIYWILVKSDENANVPLFKKIKRPSKSTEFEKDDVYTTELYPENGLMIKKKPEIIIKSNPRVILVTPKNQQKIAVSSLKTEQTIESNDMSEKQKEGFSFSNKFRIQRGTIF
jgi:hypothetical protein